MGNFLQKFFYVSGNQFIFKVVVSLILVSTTYSKACLLLVLLSSCRNLFVSLSLIRDGLIQKKSSGGGSKDLTF